MLRTRVLTAIVAVPIALLAAWQGGWLFTGLIAILALAGWREYYRLLPFDSKPGLLNSLGGLFCCSFVFFEQWNPSFFSVEIFWTLALILVFSTIFIFRDPLKIPLLALSFFGISYLGIGFSQFIKVRNWEIADMSEGGLIILATVVVATWMNDSLAYFAGTLFGKRKLCPTISPAKSWEGAYAGIIAAVATIAGSKIIFALPFSWMSLILLGIIVGITGILGDLVESGLKRWAGIKDSGNFFPGHGGVLDRMDSLLFVIPTTFIWLWLTSSTGW